MLFNQRTLHVDLDQPRLVGGVPTHGRGGMRSTLRSLPPQPFHNSLVQWLLKKCIVIISLPRDLLTLAIKVFRGAAAFSVHLHSYSNTG